MSRSKDPKAKITYIRLNGELDEMVNNYCEQIRHPKDGKPTKKAEIVRRILKVFKDSGLVLA